MKIFRFRLSFFHHIDESTNYSIKIRAENDAGIGISSSSVPVFIRTPSTKKPYVNFNTGAIGGMIIGGVLLLTIFIILLFCVRKRVEAVKRNKVAIVYKDFCYFIKHSFIEHLLISKGNFHHVLYRMYKLYRLFYLEIFGTLMEWSRKGIT